jgi:hypothetical protein
VDPLLKKIADERQALRAGIKAAHEHIRASQDRLGKLDELEKLAVQLFSPEIQPPVGTLSLLSALPSPTASVSSIGASVMSTLDHRTTKKDRILDTARDVLSDGKRRSGRELVEELKKRGVDIGGADPVNNLAAYLSPDERFDSKRSEGGWGLVLPPKKGGPNDAPTSTGPIGVNNGAVQRPSVAR